MTCGNGYTIRHLSYRTNAIRSRANPRRTGMSGSPSPPLAEPCDETDEPTPYRDGEAARTA